jgi:hypothetical protein
MARNLLSVGDIYSCFRNVLLLWNYVDHRHDINPHIGNYVNKNIISDGKSLGIQEQSCENLRWLIILEPWPILFGVTQVPEVVNMNVTK